MNAIKWFSLTSPRIFRSDARSCDAPEPRRWNSAVPGAVNDQHRTAIVRQNGAQRALVGIVEVSRVFDCKRRPPEEARSAGNRS